MDSCKDEIKIREFKSLLRQRMQELNDMEDRYTHMKMSDESAQSLQREGLKILEQAAAMAAEFLHVGDEIGGMERKWMAEF